MLKQTIVRGKNTSLNGFITEGRGRERWGQFLQAAISTSFQGCLALSILLSCRFRKLSVQPDLDASKGLGNYAVSFGQFSLLKKLLLVDP